MREFILQEDMDLPLANSTVSGFNSESLKYSSSEKSLDTSKIAPFIQLDDKPGTPATYEEHLAFEATAIRPKVGKTYTIYERKEKLSSSIPLPMSAASYYIRYSPVVEIVESCESISNLNAYLKARRDDVNAGVPGRFLHAVIAFDATDVGTVVSTIMYAFYLNESSKSQQYFCPVPIINIKRDNLGSHAELKWLLDSCQIDQSSLIFEDEIDLSYYDLFGSLRIVLLKSSKISRRQEKFKHNVVEIFNCRKDEAVYPWVKTVTMREDYSTCTAIAEKFAQWSPEILADKSFSKLLLAGILLDTANLEDPQCTSKDKYMASLLINGAGRYGCNGFYQLLKHKMYDMTNLQVVGILQKDFKKWTRLDSRSSKQIGMSCIGISIGQFIAHSANLAQEIKYFRYLEKLEALIIVSGYYEEEKKFKREILVSAESSKLLESLIFFFNFNASRLPLKSLHQSGLKDDMKAFEIDKITSRKTIEGLLEEFVGAQKV